MDAWLFLSTLALLWGPVHVYLTKRDLVDLKEWVGWVNQHVQDVLKEARAARVDDEMVKLRQRNVKRLARYFTHLGFVTTLGFSYDAVRQPGQLDTIIWALISFQCYVQNVMVGKEFIQISPGRLKFFTYTGHITCLLLSIITGMSTSVLKFAAMHSFDTALRFVIVFIFLDPSVSIPFQLLYTTVDMLIYVFVLEGSVMQVIPLCFGQFFICALSIASSIFLDLVLRGRIDALLDTADAESLVSSFRRVLRGVCDGEVLLDSRMNVTKDSECLKHLILTNVSLTGKCFQDLLADEEERRRFTEFIHSSTRTFSEAKALQSPPVCLRVSLLGSEGIRVAADLYHVPVPGLFGVEEASHLIAFKEDPEPRPPKAAQDGAVPAALLPAGAMPGMWHGRGRPWDVSSVWSGSTGRSSAVHVGDVALQEMFLLVDADTELQDVEQVEVNFKRHEELDLPTALHSGMPSLRKLVQPMDWEKVRSRVSRFVEKSLRDEKVQSKTMNPMTVQLPGLNGWLLVDEATVHRNQGAKVWLHLRGFRPVRRSRPDPVRGIPESSGVW